MELRRTPKSAAEIAALPALGTTQCMEQVRAHGAAFDAESLVHLLRKSLDLHDTSFFELCGRYLIGNEGTDGRWHGGHCEGIIVNLARYYGFVADRQLMREFRTNCHGALWIAVYGGRPFWEMRFGMAFSQKCIEIARSLVRERTRGVELRDLGVADGGRVPDVDDITDPDVALIDNDVLARLSNPTHKAVLLAAVRSLPKRQGAAVLLAWIEERQIEGEGQDTVSSLMAITPRAVRKLLAQARKTLQSNPAVRAIWFGEA